MSRIDEAEVVPFPQTWAGERRQIVSFGGGGFSMEAGNTLLDDHVLSLTAKDGPGSASYRRPAATRTTTSSASTGRSPPSAASRPICPCSGAIVAAQAATCASSCSART